MTTVIVPTPTFTTTGATFTDANGVWTPNGTYRGYDAFQNFAGWWLFVGVRSGVDVWSMQTTKTATDGGQHYYSSSPANAVPSAGSYISVLGGDDIAPTLDITTVDYSINTDLFDDSSLDPAWDVALNGGTISETSNPGYLTVLPRKGGTPTDGSNILNAVFTPAWIWLDITGDFEIETFLEIHTPSAYQGAGIIIADETGDNSVFIGRKYSNGHVIARQDTVNQGSVILTHIGFYHTIYFYYFKAKRVGSVFKTYWKLNEGDTWTERSGGQPRWTSSGPVRLGIGGINPNIYIAPAIKFDYVKITLNLPMVKVVHTQFDEWDISLAQTGRLYDTWQIYKTIVNQMYDTWDIVLGFDGDDWYPVERPGDFPSTPGVRHPDPNQDVTWGWKVSSREEEENT